MGDQQPRAVLHIAHAWPVLDGVFTQFLYVDHRSERDVAKRWKLQTACQQRGCCNEVAEIHFVELANARQVLHIQEVFASRCLFIIFRPQALTTDLLWGPQ